MVIMSNYSTFLFFLYYVFYIEYVLIFYCVLTNLLNRNINITTYGVSMIYSRLFMGTFLSRWSNSVIGDKYSSNF